MSHSRDTTAFLEVDLALTLRRHSLDALIGAKRKAWRGSEPDARWAAPRRPLDWVLSMVEFTPMSPKVAEDLLWRFGRAEDPKIEARRQRILQVLLEASPKVREQLVEEGFKKGRLVQQRDALRQVLAGRRITVKPDDAARIESCSSLATLKRWFDQALRAKTATEALR